MSTSQEEIFILLKVIKRQKEKQPDGHSELTKLKAIIILFISLKRK